MAPQDKKPNDPVTRRRRRRNLILWIIAVVALNIAYLAYAPARTTEHLAYSDSLPNISLTDLDGKHVSLDNHWVLALIFDCSAEPLRRTKYAEILYRRYQERGLLVVGITNEPASKVRECAGDSNITFPVVHDDGVVKARLRTETHTFFAFLVDPSKHVRFSTDVADPRDLRMIVEKYVVGKIDYRPVQTSDRLKAGDRFEAGPLASLGSSASAPQFGEGDHAIVFSARCSVCSLESGLTSVRAWEKARQDSTPATLIFSAKFTRAELLDRVQKTQMQAPAYQAVDSISGIEDPYSLDGLFSDDIVVATFGRNQNIAKIESWNSFVGIPTASKENHQ